MKIINFFQRNLFTLSKLLTIMSDGDSIGGMIGAGIGLGIGLGIMRRVSDDTRPRRKGKRRRREGFFGF
jgi:hypothetical protein